MQDRGRQSSGRRNCGGEENHSSSGGRGARREIAMGSEEGPSVPRDKREMARRLHPRLFCFVPRATAGGPGARGAACLPVCRGLLHTGRPLAVWLLRLCVLSVLPVPAPACLQPGQPPCPASEGPLRVCRLSGRAAEISAPATAGPGELRCVLHLCYVCVYLCPAAAGVYVQREAWRQRCCYFPHWNSPRSRLSRPDPGAPSVSAALPLSAASASAQGLALAGTSSGCLCSSAGASLSVLGLLL